MKKAFLAIPLFILLLFILAACGKSEPVTPAPTEATAGVGADSAIIPLPSDYTKDIQVDEAAEIFHVIDSFEQNGAAWYVVLSGSIEYDGFFSKQIVVTDGQKVFYEYNLLPYSLKVSRENQLIIKAQDINFDGFSDFWLWSEDGDYFWLWNVASQTFERNPALEALELGYPNFDENDKAIYSYHGKKGEDTILMRVFEYRESAPVLTGYTERVYYETQDRAITTTYELQNGKMCAADSVSRLIPRYYIHESTNTFSLVQIVPAQQEIPPLCITIVGELQDGRYYGNEALIVSLTDGSLLQKIHLRETDMLSIFPEFSRAAETSLILEDINFDGYFDMCILYDTGASFECVRYWLWDKAQGIFQLDDTLEALHLGEITVDAKTKTFTSYYADSVVAYTERTFQYIDGAPVLIRQEEADYDVERDKVVTTIQERIDGELRTVEVREE